MVAILTLIVQFLTLCAICLSVWYAIRQINKQHEWNRRKSAQDLADKLSQGELAETRKTLEKVVRWYDKEHTYANLDASDKTPELNHHIKNFLNFFEGISLGCKHKIYDEDIAYEYFGSVLPEAFRWTKPFIEERRRLSNDVTIYIEIETLSDKWTRKNEEHQHKLSELAKTPGKPAL